MKPNILSPGIVILAATFLVATVSTSQEKQSAPDIETMMKTWEKVALPGEAHKKLNDFAGSWETISTMWMEGPDKPPTVTKGTAELQWTLDGRFLRQEASGEMFGKPMHGMGFTGYDNVNKRYQMFWIDNSSTAMYTADGIFDQSGKVLTMYGKLDDPTTGEHGKNTIYVSRKIDKDKFVFEFHDPAFSPNTKVGEILYIRKK